MDSDLAQLMVTMKMKRAKAVDGEHLNLFEMHLLLWLMGIWFTMMCSIP